MSSSAFILALAVLFMGQTSAQRRPPNYSLDDMPETSFDCSDKIEGGYYADPEADCQMFHVCVRMPGNDVQDYRFLCPNDTMFDQENRICANWFDIDCEAAAVYYGNSFDLYRIGSSGPVDQRLTEIVASPSPIIALGPSTPRAPLSKPRTAGTGFYSSRRAGPRNGFEVNNAADDESLIRSATGDRRLQNADRQVESEADPEVFDEAPKRRTNPKKKVSLRKISRNRGGNNDAYSGVSTKVENEFSSSKVYYSTTSPAPTPESSTATTYRSNYNNNFRGSSNYDGFQRNGGNRNGFISTTTAAPETTVNARKFNNDYRSSNQQQQGGNFNFQQQRDYKSPSTAAPATSFSYNPSTTLSPPSSSFSGNFQNYQKPPSRPSVAPTSPPQSTKSFGSGDRSASPTTFTPTSDQNNYNNNYNYNRNNVNDYDRANPAPTTYSPPTSKANKYNSFASNNYNANPAPTTYSPATSKSTNYNPYTANFNNNYNPQPTTVAPQTGSDFNSFRTSNFQRNNYNAVPSTTAQPTTYPSTAFAPTSRRQPFNSRRTFQSPPPFQAAAEDDKESLKTAQSANFGSNDDYQTRNSFQQGFNNKAQVNYTKNYYSSTQSPVSYQTVDRGNNRAQNTNGETTAAFTARPFKFSQNNDAGFIASTTAVPATRGNNYRSSNTYTNPIPNSPSTQAVVSNRANSGFNNRAPSTTAQPQNTANNVNVTPAKQGAPQGSPQQLPQTGATDQKQPSDDYNYAYYDSSGPEFDYEGFDAEADSILQKTKA